MRELRSFQRGALAVFAVFAGNYQRRAGRSPQKSWIARDMAKEKQRDNSG
jgi:hypothetical protein